MRGASTRQGRKLLQTLITSVSSTTERSLSGSYATSSFSSETANSVTAVLRVLQSRGFRSIVDAATNNSSLGGLTIYNRSKGLIFPRAQGSGLEQVQFLCLVPVVRFLFRVSTSECQLKFCWRSCWTGTPSGAEVQTQMVQHRASPKRFVLSPGRLSLRRLANSAWC